MKREKKVWARTVTAVAFGMSLGFAVLVQTAARAEENAPAAETEQTGETMLVQADAQQPLPITSAVNLSGLAADSSAGEDFENDPFEGFNEKMFWFNREVVDRYVLKPIATGWDFLLPDPVQRGVHNFFDNLAVVRK